MKKLALLLCTSWIFLIGVGRAQETLLDDEEMLDDQEVEFDAPAKPTKEIKKNKKHQERDRRRRERAMRKEKERFARENRQKEERIKKEKEDARKRFEKEEKEEAQRLAREEKKQARDARKHQKKEAEAREALIRETEKRQREEKFRLKEERQKQEETFKKKKDQDKENTRVQKVKFTRQQRKDLMDKWKELHVLEVDRDYDTGKYADLCKVPTWPTYATFWGKKGFTNATASYHFATDAYGSSGGNGDIMRLVVGEDQVTLQDILFVRKLLNDSKIKHIAGGSGNFGGILEIADYEPIIKFDGKVEQCGVTLDLARYLIRNNFAIGIQVPILQRKHTVTASIPYITHNDFANYKGDDAANGIRSAFLDGLFKAKGINELGGSRAGFGDVTLFSNVQFNSYDFERVILGARIQLPSATKASTDKFWCPELGNGGMISVGVYGAALVSYKKYFNPHILLEGNLNATTNVNRRVPKLLTRPHNSDGSLTTGNVKTGTNGLPLSFGDRFDYKDGTSATDFTEYDTIIPALGDYITKVTWEKGPEVKMRLGNMFESVLLRRGFLDVFYDVRLKWKDSYRGISAQEWNLEALRENTNQLEHKVGAVYAYQFDGDTRFNMGIGYAIAGHNTPKAVDASASLNYSF
jgi:hypothetical protein